MTEQTTAPTTRRRKRKVDVKTAAAELLTMTLQAAKDKLEFHAEEGLPIDAATISANVALLKMTEAYENETKDKAGESNAELAAAFHAKTAERAARPTPAPTKEDLLSEYGLA
ncbi:hypothetical protein ACU683_23375 [Pseudomonas salmasensis]